jgi:hypothetical protein
MEKTMNKYYTWLFGVLVIINSILVIVNATDFKRDHAWWERHGCINGVINYEQSIPKDFQYKHYDDVFSKTFDEAADKCIKSQAGK